MPNYYQHNGTSYVHVSDYAALEARLAERDRQVDEWARFSESHGLLDAQEFTEWIAYLQRRLAEAELSRDSWKREAKLNQQAADESAGYARRLAETEALLREWCACATNSGSGEAIAKVEQQFVQRCRDTLLRLEDSATVQQGVNHEKSI